MRERGVPSLYVLDRELKWRWADALSPANGRSIRHDDVEDQPHRHRDQPDDPEVKACRRGTTVVPIVSGTCHRMIAHSLRVPPPLRAAIGLVVQPDDRLYSEYADSDLLDPAPFFESGNADEDGDR